MTSIAWFAGEVAAAQAQALAERRPLLLYWGAAWCPPCNRVQSALFRHAGVVGLSRAAVPLCVDGDSPGAQRLAARLKLRSYPTLVLYRPDGAEITRLPCELDGDQFAAALALALGAAHTAPQSLLAALSSSRALAADEWRLLSLYSWDTDEGQLLGARALAPTLAALAAACPAGAAQARLDLHALAAAPALDGDAVARLLRVCGDAALARANLDLLVNHAAKWMKNVVPPPSSPLLAALLGVARRAADDASLSAPDRLAALRTQGRLARFGAPADGLAPALRAAVAAFARDGGDPSERHTLINTAAGALAEAGLAQDADALLNAELARSHAPFFFMQTLAANARRRGDTAAALRWYQQAWGAAQGGATRLQWGATYLLALADLAPAQTDRLELAATGVLADLRATPDAFEQRNRTQMERIGAALGALAGAGAQSAALLGAIRAGR